MYLLFSQVGNLQHQEQFFLLFELCPTHEELWYGKKQLFWFSLVRAGAVTHGAPRADHLVSICRLEKRFFLSLKKHKQWHSFQLILLYVHIFFHCLLSLFPTSNQILTELLHYSMETVYAGRCCSLSPLIARRSRAGVQLTVSANVK